MSAIDDLDAESDAPVPGSAKKISPTTARRMADAIDPQEARQKRAARWEALIPEGVTGKLREDLEAALDLAHYAMGWPVNKLAQEMVTVRNEVAQANGLEPDDPKTGRATALKMVKTVEAAALSQNPFADTSPELERYINKTSAYARTLGWSPNQIGLMLKNALVQAEGDKEMAAGLFASYVIEEGHERGYRGSASLDSLPGYSERGSELAASEDSSREDLSGADLEDDRIAQMSSPGDDDELKPDNEPYTPDRWVTVYGARDDNHVLDGFAMRTDELQTEVKEREVRGRIADEKIAVVDKVAATVLKPVDYAVYRVMRDEAYRIGATADVDMPLARVVQEKLHYEKRQGADEAMKRVQKQLAAQGLADVAELSAVAQRRLAMTTEQAVEAGVAAKPRRGAGLE